MGSQCSIRDSIERIPTNGVVHAPGSFNNSLQLLGIECDPSLSATCGKLLVVISITCPTTLPPVWSRPELAPFNVRCAKHGNRYSCYFLAAASRRSVSIATDCHKLTAMLLG
jgi:hypothetical protein